MSGAIGIVIANAGTSGTVTLARAGSAYCSFDASATVVSTDTGAAHVAGMLGVPVVDVFPDRDFAAQARRWRPWASPSRLVRASSLRGGAAATIIEAELNAF